MVRRFIKDETGSSAIEYALIASLIAIAAIAGYQAVGSSTGNLYENNASEITNALD